MDEFKWMVDRTSTRCEVIIDVVYNHTGEGSMAGKDCSLKPEEMESFNYDPKEVAGVVFFSRTNNASWCALFLTVKPIGTIQVLEIKHDQTIDLSSVNYGLITFLCRRTSC